MHTTRLSSAVGPDRLRPWRDELVATLRLSWPLVATNLAQTALSATDVVMLGRLGPEALAAGALGANLYNACMLFALGLVSATAALVAAERGRRRHAVREVRRTVRQGFWAAVAVTLPLWVLLWNGERILLAFGQDPALAAAAGTYVRAMQFGLLPFLGFVVLRSFLSALERPMPVLVVGLFAVLFNVAANECLIFGRLGLPALGLPGAGLASALASLAMLLGLSLVVMRDRFLRRYHLFGRFWRADWPRFGEIWRIGLPIAFTIAFEITVFNAAVFLMGLISTRALAAHAIAIQIAALSFMVPLGLGQAATVRVGLAFGAGDEGGVARAGGVALALAVGFMATMAGMMVTFPEALVGAFLDLSRPDSAAVLALAVSFLAVAALFQIVDGIQVVGAGMLRGLQDTRVPMLYAALGYWGIGLPVGSLLAFRFDWGGIGLWIGLAVGLATVAALMLARWMRRAPVATRP